MIIEDRTFSFNKQIQIRNGVSCHLPDIFYFSQTKNSNWKKFLPLIGFCSSTIALTEAYGSSMESPFCKEFKSGLCFSLARRSAMWCELSKGTNIGQVRLDHCLIYRSLLDLPAGRLRARVLAEGYFSDDRAWEQGDDADGPLWGSLAWIMLEMNAFQN